MIQSLSVRTDIIFKEDRDGCSNNPGSANMDYPYEDVSECEVEGVEDCRKNKIDSNYCEGLKERFRDDCEGFKNKQECDEWWEKQSRRAYCMENYGMPCCDETQTSSEGECYDEGDPDDCEPGFVDRGFGCEPEDNEIIDQCPPGSAPEDWCTHLCDEPEYKDDPLCNPNVNPPVLPIEPEPEPEPGPPECPEGQVGTPPDCETPPGILPPPDNGEDPPDNGEDPPEDNEGGEDEDSQFGSLG